MATILHPPALDAINASLPKQGRIERKAEEYLTCYVEALSDARTKLADIFTFLPWRLILSAV